MKKVYFILFVIPLYFGCKAPTVTLNYDKLVNEHLPVRSETSENNCQHMYVVKYSYCDFYKENENIIDFGLQFNDSLCLNSAKLYQYLSLIEVYSKSDSTNVSKVLLVSFIYPKEDRSEDSVNQINSGSNIPIQGPAIVYSGEYKENNKTELLLNKKYTYKNKSFSKSKVKLKKRQAINLSLNLKRDDSYIHCERISNLANNRLGGEKAIVFEIPKTLGIEAIAFEKISSECKNPNH